MSEIGGDADLKTDAETLDEINRKITAYTVADYRMIDKIGQFIAERSYARFKKWSQPEKAAFVAEWSRFMLEYVETGKVDNLPHNWSPSEVFPVVNIATVGDAGTGKTHSMINMHSMTPGMCATGPVNKSTDSYVNSLMAAGKPFGQLYTRGHNTWFKFLSLQFSDAIMNKLYNSVKDNDAIQNSFRSLVDTGKTTDVRDHVKTVLKHMHEYIVGIVQQRRREFLLFGGFRFRLCVRDDTVDSPFYQPPARTFDFVNQADEVLKKSCGGRVGYIDNVLCKDIYLESDEFTATRLEFAGQVTDQEGYRRYVNWVNNHDASEKDRFPPMLAVNPITLAEEDGRSPAFIKILHAIDYIIVSMIYNPPHWYERPCAYVSSGSLNQSMVIGVSTSVLEYILSPPIISDCDNTMVWKSEYFRRDRSTLNSLEAEVHSTLCLNFERNLPITQHSLATLAFREEFPSLSNDPAHYISGSRFFSQHKDIRKFNDQVEKRNLADIEVYDVIYVSSNVVLLNVDELGPREPSKIGYAVNDKKLSALSADQARRNRYKLWKRKARVYCPKNQEVRINVATKDQDRTGSVCYDFAYDPDIDAKLDAELFAIKAARDQQGANSERDRHDLDADEIETAYFLKTDGKSKKEIFARCKRRYMSRPVDTDTEYDADYEEPIASRKINRDKKLKSVLDTGVDVEKSGDDDDEDLNLTKMFVKAPARLMFSRENHGRHRIYAAAIAKYLGDGTKVADKYFCSSKAVDQASAFCYKPDYDVATVYAAPDFKILIDGQPDCIKRFNKTVDESVACVQMHMAFMRKRMFVTSGAVTDIGRKTNIVLRGLRCTFRSILQDHNLNHYTPPAFRLACMIGMIDQFRRYLCETRLLGNHQTKTFDDVSDAVKNYATYEPLPFAQEDLDVMLKCAAMVDNIKDAYSDSKLNKTVETAYKKPTESSRGGDNDKTIGTPAAMCATVGRWINGIAERHPIFSRIRELTVYVCETPVYDVFKKSILSALCLYSLDVTSAGDVAILGNGDHPCLSREKAAAMSQRADIDAQPNWGEYGSESFLDFRGKMKTESSMTKWAVDAWFPELSYKTISVILIHGKIIASTLPRFDASVDWAKLFTSPVESPHAAKKKTWYGRLKSECADRFGIMLRQNQAAVRICDSALYHQTFFLSAGESVQFPRPFVLNGGRRDCVSGVIVKTKRDVYHYARNPCLKAFVKDDKLVTRIMTVSEAQNLRQDDLKTKKIEAGAAFGIMCPLMVAYSSTYHSEQGATRVNKVFLDLSKLVAGNRNATIDTTSSLLLVGLSRVTMASNIRVSNVDAATRYMVLQSNTYEQDQVRKKKRRSNNAMIKYECFR